MKQFSKLNPIVDKQDPLVSELRVANKLLEDIRETLSGPTKETNEVILEALKKLLDESNKQKKIINRVRLVVESKVQRTESLEMTHGQKVEEPSELQRKTESDYDIKILLSEQNRMLAKQNEILGFMGNLMVGVDRKLGGEDKPNSLPNAPTKKISTYDITEIVNIIQHNPNDKEGTRAIIERWVGEMMTGCSDHAFTQLINKADEESVRIEYAATIIDEYRKFILRMSLLPFITLETLEEVFFSSSKNTLGYLKFKYPQAKKKIADMSMTAKIPSTAKEVDNEFGILRRGEIDLNFSNDLGLRSSIKAMINKLIVHSDDSFKGFKEDMMKIFLKVEADDRTKGFYFFVGRKIKQSTHPYTEAEVESPSFFVKGNEVLRILLKWVQELMGYFTQKEKITQASKFMSKDGMKRLGIKNRELMWAKFQNAYNKVLKKQLKVIDEDLRRTVSNIILVSDNNIGTKTNPGVYFIDKDESSLLMICQYIWKALENYVMDVLVSLLNRFAAIRQIYAKGAMEEADLDIFTLKIGDLFRCKCSGSKEQVMQVYNLLRKTPDIEVVRVKNRLGEGTQDLLLNFVYKNTEKCFFICEMQLALSTAQEEVNDHFNHFLYEQFRAQHGVIAELGIMLYNLDTRRPYITKEELIFIPKEKKFTQREEELVCAAHPEAILEGKSKTKSYVCSYCCKFINAYQFFLDAKLCPICLNSICPQCQFQILPKEALNTMYSLMPKLSSYFEPIKGPLLNKSVAVIKERIQKIFNKEDYIAIVSMKNNTNSINVDVITCFKAKDEVDENHEESEDSDYDPELVEAEYESSEESKSQSARSIAQNAKEEDKTKYLWYYLKTFTYEEFQFEKIEDSIVYLLRPRNCNEVSLEEYKSAKEGNAERFESMYNLHTYFLQNEDLFCKLFTIRNPETGKDFVMDYVLSSSKDLQKRMSANKILRLVETLNKSKQERTALVLNKCDRNFSILSNIKEPERVREIELSRISGAEDVKQPEKIDPTKGVQDNSENSTTFKVFEIFCNVEILTMEKVGHYYNHLNYKFNENLVQLSIKNCSLRWIDYNQLSKRLKNINLSNNWIEDLPVLDFPSLEALDLDDNSIVKLGVLETSNLPNLCKLILSRNEIDDEMPKLDLPSLKILNAAKNFIHSITKLAESKMPKLSYLHLEHNLVPSLPDLSNFLSLNTLKLFSNKIVSTQLSSHPKLEVLELNDNLLTSMPILNMKALIILDLSTNQIESQETIYRLIGNQSFDEFKIYGNPFKRLPLAITNIFSTVVEASKVTFLVQMWTVKGSEYYLCSGCKQTITTQAFYYKRNSKSDDTYFCRSCIKVNSTTSLGVENLLVEVTSDEMNKYA